MEEVFIQMALNLIESTLKNPAHSAKFKNQLIQVADAIYASYGMLPPPTKS